MDELSIWNVTTGQPQGFRRGKLILETSLEDWIERDPSLVQQGLVIVGRQLQTTAGVIDLLGIDSSGRWVVVEIKQGGLRKDTIAQVRSYAACIAEMDEDQLITSMDAYLKARKTDTQSLLAAHHIDDQIVFDRREVMIVIVGTGHDQPPEPLTKALLYQDNPIQVLSFDLFENDAGEQILVRKGVQPDVIRPVVTKPAKKTPPPLKHWPLTPAIERLFRIAAENGIGDDFRLFHETAIRHGMYPRTYRWSIMYTPPQNKTRCLICVWAKREKPREVVVYISSEAFAEFYPIPEKEVTEILGANHWERFPQGKVDVLASGLDALFEKISGNY
jgi:Holliday junction resolvase-like predicted endonuclease